MPVEVPAVAGSASIPGMRPVPDHLPGDGLGLDRAPELPVLEPGAGQDGDEPAASPMDMVEIVVTAELGWPASTISAGRDFHSCRS